MNAATESPPVTKPHPRSAWSLWALIVGVVILFVAAVAVAILVSHRDAATRYPRNSPQGTVQRYLALLQSGRVDRAYDMIMADQSRSDFDAEYGNWSDRSHRATLTSSHLNGRSATVAVEISSFEAGPFGGSSSSDQVTFTLSRQGHGWLIDGPSYLPY